MVKVLHELGNLDGGGVARLLYDYYRYMDREEVHFDFLIYDFYKEGILEKPLEELGAKIYKIPSRQSDKNRCDSMMKKIICEGQYDTVHSHRGPQGYYFLSCAKKCGVKKRIIHSHLAQPNPTAIRRIKNAILLQADKWVATDLFACGLDAGIAMWGKHDVDNGKVHIMTNAIDADKFTFSDSVRQRKRKELGLANEFTIGIVGRIEEQKNYPFLIDVFLEVLKEEPNAVLLIAGRGTEEEKIKCLAQEKKVEENILFLGIRSDVPELLNAFDVFVLPSLFEGLPVVLVEAQASGLPEVVSDTITTEMAVTDLISYMPLRNPTAWSKKILSCKSEKRERYSKIVGDSGYGICTQAKNMERYYLNSAK